MKRLSTFFSTLLFLSSLLMGTTLSGQNRVTEVRSHIDFLPRYIKKNPNVLISRIEYYNNKMVLHLRYISDKRDTISFYGKNHHSAWAIETKTHPGRADQHKLVKKGDLSNIRINDKLKANYLPATEQIAYLAERGDIVSCEMHVENMPHYVKVVNLAGGDKRLLPDGGILCSDLMLKTKGSPALGTLEQMETLVDNFYKDYNYIRYPDLKYLSSIENEKLSEESLTDNRTPIQQSMGPIDYMPKMLNSVEDLQCSERVILRNVYFEDNSAELNRRIQAMKTISVIYNYLKFYPESKIVLHGHTDVHGSPYQNLVLSKERVLTIKRIIVHKGISSNRIITVYHGGTQPLPNCEDGHELNRRVEAEIVCDKNTSTSSVN